MQETFTRVLTQAAGAERRGQAVLPDAGAAQHVPKRPSHREPPAGHGGHARCPATRPIPGQLGQPERALPDAGGVRNDRGAARGSPSCAGGCRCARPLLPRSRACAARARGNDHDQAVPRTKAGRPNARARTGLSHSSVHRAGLACFSGRSRAAAATKPNIAGNETPPTGVMSSRYDRDAPHRRRAAAHRRVAALLRHASTDALHRRIESMVAAHQSQFAPRSSRRGVRRFSPLGLASAGAVAAAVVVAAIAVGLGSGSGAPTVSFNQAAASTLRAATLPAPPYIRQTTHSLPSPSTACRSPTGRTASAGTAPDRAPIALTAAQSPNGLLLRLPRPADRLRDPRRHPRAPGRRWRDRLARWRVLPGLLTENGAAVVTWLRDGHLCVVSGRGVSSATLLRLASWSDHDAIAS